MLVPFKPDFIKFKESGKFCSYISLNGVIFDFLHSFLTS